MKKKFLIFTLCFTLIFSSLNCKKSYADMGIISAPMVGVISTIAVASGIILNNSDEIVEFSNMFYQTNKENWQEINDLFKETVSIRADKVVTIGKSFLNKVYEFLDILKVTVDGSLGSIDRLGEFTIGANYKYSDFLSVSDDIYTFDGVNVYIPSLKSTLPLCIWVTGTNTIGYVHLGYVDNEGNPVRLQRYSVSSLSNALSSTISLLPAVTESSLSGHRYLNLRIDSNGYKSHYYWFSSSTLVNDFTAQGTYDKTLVNDNLKEDGSIDIYVPGNLDSLVGVGSSDVIYNPSSTPPYDLPVGGVVAVPGVSNPSIDVNGDVSFPSVGDIPGVDSPSVPSEGIWSTIKDFIISLVVPNDTFWTDTWGGLYNNFVYSFPMVDMTGFNDLVTGEKKFPNIDINIMGITGRVVNGDVINSIVDWLRPIIAGFMMICLMLFNYRKIYKLIRNTEPFGGIAPGTSDFRTGISEYKHDYITPTGLSMPYEDFLEHAKTQRKWEMANPGQDYGKAGFTKVY